jgi:hypothetical protein
MLNLNDYFKSNGENKKVMVGSIGDNIKMKKKLLVINKIIKPIEEETNDEDDDDLNSNDNQKRSMNLNPLNYYSSINYNNEQQELIRQFEPPTIKLNPVNFMHSSVRSTEDDNREDVIINQIKELEFKMRFYSKPISWHYERFNSSNYIMVDQEQLITIWKEPFYSSSSSTSPINFKFNNKVCDIDLRNKGILIQTIFYTRIINYEQVLQFAFIFKSLNDGNFKLRSYEITGDSRCLPLYLFDLKNNRPIKLDFISTYQFGSLALLFEHQQSKPQIEYLNGEHETSTKLIKIYAKQAIDLESFIVNGGAYLAIAHLNGVNIFKFNELITHHRLYETIQIQNVKDLKSFSIGFKNFLAIATSGNYQHIFNWRSGQLLRYQILNVTNVLQWQIIKLETCRDDLLLGIIRNDPNLPFLLYTWNGVNKHFQLAIEDIRQYTPHNFIINPFSQTSFNYNSTAYILEFDRSYQPRFLAIYSSIRQVVDPVFKKLELVTSKIKSLFNSFIHQQKDINYVKSILNLAVRSTSSSSSSVIDAKQKFISNVDVARLINIQRINKMRRAIWKDSSLTLEDTNLDLNRAQTEINQLNQQTNNLKQNLLNEAVFKDKSTQVYGNKIFSNGLGIMNRLISNSMHITKANNYPLTLLLNNLVYKDMNSVYINGEKIFLSPIDIKGNLDAYLVNGIGDFFNLIAKRNMNPLILNSQINFQNGLTTHNLELKGLINNVNISKDLIYFNEKNSIQLNTPVRIISTNTTVNSLNSTSINQINLLDLYRNSLRTNGNQIMNSPLQIREAVTLNNVNVFSSKLNQHNIKYLANVLVRKDQPSQINSKIVFLNSLHLTNNLNIGRRLNSLLIPFDLVSKSRSNLITGEKRFNGRIVSLDNLEVNGLINELKYPQDVITLSLEEQINSPLVFENGFTTRKNIHLTGRVDGVKLNEFSRFIINKFSTIPADAQFMGKVFVRNNLIVDGYIEHMNLTSFANNLIQKSIGSSTRSLVISGPKLFRNSLEFKNGGLVRELNGLRINNDLLTTNGNETIYTRLKR